jgi:hypothetical protein
MVKPRDPWWFQVHIYIDESGSFIPTAGSRVSCVVALAIPTANRVQLVADFERLKRQISGNDSELKGSKLTEKQVARVVGLLLMHDAVLEACVIDMGVQKSEHTAAFKIAQADALFTHITTGHQPTLVAELEKFRDVILRLPDQLFIQLPIIVSLMRRALNTFVSYYAQRRPEELSAFHWMIDAKGASITPLEELWRTLLVPMMHMGSIETMGWADYSYMDRFSVDLPGENSSDPPRKGFDIKAIFREDLQFKDSRNDLGLQLADIAASALTRALNGSLDEFGWRRLGRLFIRQTGGTVRLVSLSEDPASDGMEYQPNFARTFSILQASARAMLKVPPGYEGP